MKITIWDLDYYYAANKRNCFNPDAMKVSSYHKQLGDKINFVTNQDDIFRPYDLYYIFKVKENIPNPPSCFFLDRKVRWWGKAVKMRVNWRMSDAMLGCRPDYLLYPNHDTALERAEHIRLFNNRAEPLEWKQDWTNTFKKKEIIVTDPYLWCATKENILDALKILAQLEKVRFLEPIWIQKIIYDEDIKKMFLQLKFKRGTSFIWSVVNVKQVEDAIMFLTEVKEHNPTTDIGTLVLDYRDLDKDHWENKQWALDDFAKLREICAFAKNNAVKILIKMPETRLSTPYYELFEALSIWTRTNFHRSWLTFLSAYYGDVTMMDHETYWSHPERWSELFRDLLLQTYKYSSFIRHIVKNKYISEITIPWKIWKEEFKYEI